MASRVQIWENNSAQRNIRKVEKSLDFRLWVYKKIFLVKIFREFQFYNSIYWHKLRSSQFCRRILLRILKKKFTSSLTFFGFLTSGDLRSLYFALWLSHCRKGFVNPFKFNNFLENISQPTLCKINISHLCKSRHRKKLLKKFRKFISQERQITIWSNPLIVSILK